MKLDWSLLYYGHVSTQEVQRAIKDAEWQELRKSIKGEPLIVKFGKLRQYQLREAVELTREDGSTEPEWRMVEVRLTNYVTALSRGGLIKPSDYR